MARLLVVALAAFVVCVCAAPADDTEKPGSSGSRIEAQHGSIGLGHISGGNYGEGSFSIGHGGNSGGSGDGGHGGNTGGTRYGGEGDGAHTSYGGK